MTTPIRVAVTGAAGQIGYALLFPLASGAAFGPDRPLSLQLLEVTPVLPALHGTIMELEDCAFPLLASAAAFDKAEEAFDGADWIILVGGQRRRDGQTRADLVKVNSPIFTSQGQAINAAAGPNVRVITVANPCNSNCLIARSHAPKVPDDRWFAMTRLDQNRAAAILAQKVGAPVSAVTRMTIWGNHSDTQYPDYKNARINGRPATDLVSDPAWFSETFIPTVAKRGVAVIQARNASSAASAANAVIDTIRSLERPTPPGDSCSAAIVSDGSYGLPSGLIYSFPLISKGGAAWSIATDYSIDAEARRRLDASAAELISEREIVREMGLLGPAA